MFLVAMEKTGLKHCSVARYMDDVRVWLRAVRLDCRWMDDRIVFKSSWRLEELEAGMTGLQKTREILHGVINSISTFLNLVMENEDDFVGSVLPTLDLEL